MRLPVTAMFEELLRPFQIEMAEVWSWATSNVLCWMTPFLAPSVW